MASPPATESPTINRAWEAFVLHVPAILLAWIAAMGISVIGTLVYFVISLVLTTLSGADPNGGGARSWRSPWGSSVNCPSPSSPVWWGCCWRRFRRSITNGGR